MRKLPLTSTQKQAIKRMHNRKQRAYSKAIAHELQVRPTN